MKSIHSHRHQITSGQELHHEVQIRRVLERVVQLDDPGRVGLCEYVSLGSDVGELGGVSRCKLQLGNSDQMITKEGS